MSAQRVFAETFSWSGNVDHQRAWAETTRYWVVFWDAPASYVTGSPFDALVGNGPLIVPKDGSAPFTFGSAEDWRAALETRGEVVLRLVGPRAPTWQPADDDWI